MRDPQVGIVVLEERGSHVLVSCGPAFAVLERRNGKLYDPCRGNVEIAGDAPDRHAAAWTDEATARAAFAAIVERGEELARRIW